MSNKHIRKIFMCIALVLNTYTSYADNPLKMLETSPQIIPYFDKVGEYYQKENDNWKDQNQEDIQSIIDLLYYSTDQLPTLLHFTITVLHLQKTYNKYQEIMGSGNNCCHRNNNEQHLSSINANLNNIFFLFAYSVCSTCNISNLFNSDYNHIISEQTTNITMLFLSILTRIYDCQCKSQIFNGHNIMIIHSLFNILSKHLSLHVPLVVSSQN